MKTAFEVGFSKIMNYFQIGTVSVAVYGYRTHWFRRRIRLYNQNEAYNSVAVYGYGTNSPWNGSVAVQNRPLLMYEGSQSFICAGELRIDCFPDLCKLVVHYLHYIYINRLVFNMPILKKKKKSKKKQTKQNKTENPAENRKNI